MPQCLKCTISELKAVGAVSGRHGVNRQWSEYRHISRLKIISQWNWLILVGILGFPETPTVGQEHVGIQYTIRETHPRIVKRKFSQSGKAIFWAERGRGKKKRLCLLTLIS